MSDHAEGAIAESVIADESASHQNFDQAQAGIAGIIADKAADAPRQKDITLEQISHLLILEKLDALRCEFHTKGIELRERQKKVRWLHDLLQRINKRVDKETGELNLAHPMIEEKTGQLKEGACPEGDPDLQDLLALREKLREAANDKGYEIKVQSHYCKDERERMTENIRMVCDDLIVQNDMQLQDLNQLVTERYEVYQLARTIQKPLHEDKVHKARSASGRG